MNRLFLSAGRVAVASAAARPLPAGGATSAAAIGPAPIGWSAIGRAAICWSASSLLAGCAAPVDIRSVGTASGAPLAFEMRGPSLASLDAQARQLCPGGHQVLRQWQRLHRQAVDATKLARWLAQAEEATGFVEADEAQLLVQCAEGGLPAPSPASPASAATPASPAAPLAAGPPSAPSPPLSPPSAPPG